MTMLALSGDLSRNSYAFDLLRWQTSQKTSKHPVSGQPYCHTRTTESVWTMTRNHLCLRTTSLLCREMEYHPICTTDSLTSILWVYGHPTCLTMICRGCMGNYPLFYCFWTAGEHSRKANDHTFHQLTFPEWNPVWFLLISLIARYATHLPVKRADHQLRVRCTYAESMNGQLILPEPVSLWAQPMEICPNQITFPEASIDRSDNQWSPIFYWLIKTTILSWCQREHERLFCPLNVVVGNS